MDDGLRRDTKLRIDEIEDLAGRMAADPNASDADLRRWLGEIKDRLTLLRNVLGVALGDGGGTVNVPSKDLKAIQPEWDRPCDQVMADKGVSLIECWAVKNVMENAGLVLQHPAPPESKLGGWHNVGSGGLPADWEERIRTGQPLH